MEDVFKKETQKVVGSFSNAKKASKRKTSKVVNKASAEALAASDKGSYSEQDKKFARTGRFGQRRRRSGSRFQCHPL